MCSYCKKHEETEVPDPYYGGAQGFEKVTHKVLLVSYRRFHDLKALLLLDKRILGMRAYENDWPGKHSCSLKHSIPPKIECEPRP